MTALEELKESTKEAVFAGQRSLADPSSSSPESLRDTLLELLSDSPAFYKLTMAQVRSSKDLDEIAALWKEAHDFYAALQSLWKTMSALGLKDELFWYLGPMIDKLERATAEHYDFHAQ